MELKQRSITWPESEYAYLYKDGQASGSHPRTKKKKISNGFVLH